MHPARRSAVVTRRRGDGRRLTRLSRLARRVGGIVSSGTSEDDLSGISAARRAAELIAFYWPRVYARYVRRLPVTPVSMYAVAYLFLELADGRLMELYPNWEEPVDPFHPFRNFRRRLTRPNPDALYDLYYAQSNIWAPEPCVYGLEGEWVANSMPDDHYALVATMWKLWKNNPMYIGFLEFIGTNAEALVQSQALKAQIRALEPLPAFAGREALNGFWRGLDQALPLETHPTHRVSLADALTWPLAFSDNEFANTTTDELQEQYYGNFGIQWRDHEHVAQVKERQEQATAYIAAFWELTDIAIAYPPFIGMLGEALHEVGEAVRVVYPGPDMDRIRAEVRAAIQGGELPPGAFADAIEPDPEDGDARVAALLQSIRPRGVLLAPPYLQEDMHDLFAHEARLHDEAAEAARDPAPAPAAA